MSVERRQAYEYKRAVSKCIAEKIEQEQLKDVRFAVAGLAEAAFQFGYVCLGKRLTLAMFDDLSKTLSALPEKCPLPPD